MITTFIDISASWQFPANWRVKSGTQLLTSQQQHGFAINSGGISWPASSEIESHIGYETQTDQSRNRGSSVLNSNPDLSPTTDIGALGRRQVQWLYPVTMSIDYIAEILDFAFMVVPVFPIRRYSAAATRAVPIAQPSSRSLNLTCNWKTNLFKQQTIHLLLTLERWVYKYR